MKNKLSFSIKAGLGLILSLGLLSFKNSKPASITTPYVYDSVKVTSTYRFNNDVSGKSQAFARIVYPIFADKQLNAAIKKTVLSAFTVKHTFNNSLMAAPLLAPSTDPIYKSASNYNELATNFIKQFELQDKDDTQKAYWYADINVTVLYAGKDYISCLCKTDYFVGTQHDEYDYAYINYDVHNHRLISLKSQFKPNSFKTLSFIAERNFRINEQLSPSQSLGNYLFDDARFELTNNFTITNQGLKFLYVPYEVKPLAFGNTEIVIPFNDLKDVILPNSMLAIYAARVTKK